MFTLTDTVPVTGPRLDAFAFPADTAVFAVGDVHGHKRKLAELLDGLADVRTPGKRRHLVFLGDLLDRGPDSVGTFHLAATAGREYGFDDVTYLPGNHELMLLDAMDWMANPLRAGAKPVLNAEPKLGNWLVNGGMAVLEEVKPTWGAGDWMGDRDALVEALPLWNGVPLLDHLRTCATHLRVGDAVFVHAGVAPKRPLADTLDLDRASHLDSKVGDRHWAWVRKPFLEWPFGWTEDGRCAKGDGKPGKLVVHGHTAPAGVRTGWLDDPELLLRNFGKFHSARLCLDGGAAQNLLVAGALLTDAGVRLAAADGLDG
jgi:serine/threonine protein phosphatase 1